MNEQHFDALPPVSLLPLPKSEAGGQNGEVATNSQAEQEPAATGNQASAGFVSPSAVPSTQPVALPVQDDQSDPAAALTPPIADDVDLIEKEWVDKAKQIVERTKQDPYLQNEEMTKMKADYLKKRYNRDIKVTKT